MTTGSGERYDSEEMAWRGFVPSWSVALSQEETCFTLLAMRRPHCFGVAITHTAVYMDPA
jgi:hypothetical protein